MLGMLVGSAAGIPVVVSYWRASTSDVGESFLASPLATLGTFLFLALPLSFAYAILRHRLFDIRVLIRQGLRYALARRALLALVPVLLVALGVDVLAHGAEPVGDVLRSRGWVYLVVGVTDRDRPHAAAGLARRPRSTVLPRALQRAAAAPRRLPTTCGTPRVSSWRRRRSWRGSSRRCMRRSSRCCVRDADGRRYRAVAAFPPGAAPEALEADNRVLALARLVASPLEIARLRNGMARPQAAGRRRAVDAGCRDRADRADRLRR